VFSQFRNATHSYTQLLKLTLFVPIISILGTIDRFELSKATILSTRNLCSGMGDYKQSASVGIGENSLTVKEQKMLFGVL
jgi:hypothetical protein